MIAMLWANQIILGNKTYADVPRLLKAKVKELLIESGCGELVVEQTGNSGFWNTAIGGYEFRELGFAQLPFFTLYYIKYHQANSQLELFVPLKYGHRRYR